MRLSFHFIVLGLALAPTVAAAESISWARYQVPETGAAVDIPTSIFSEQAGKPEAGYGGRFLTSDGRGVLHHVADIGQHDQFRIRHRFRERSRMDVRRDGLVDFA